MIIAHLCTIIATSTKLFVGHEYTVMHAKHIRSMHVQSNQLNCQHLHNMYLKALSGFLIMHAITIHYVAS